jgi:heme/copper-type cytochrome/quinol oxidase subunit 3
MDNHNSISRNALIPVHSTLVSINISMLLGSFLLTFMLYMHLISCSLYIINPVSSILLLYYVLALWLNNVILESNMGIYTMTELSCISLGFIIFIISEIMIFYALFWCYLNGWIQCTIYIYYSFPAILIIPIIPFTLPLSNLLILYFSSIPLQSVVLFIKTGYRLQSIEGIGGNILCGLIFMILQFKEYIYSYFMMSFGFYGTIFYMITGVHGIHVCLGIVIYYIMMIWLDRAHSYSLYINRNNSMSIGIGFIFWFSTMYIWYFYNFFNLNWIPRSRFGGCSLCAILRIQGLWNNNNTIIIADSLGYVNNVSMLYIEYHVCIQLWSNYWHFVDCLWFLVIWLCYV